MEQNEPPFHEPWERVAATLVFATNMQLAPSDEIRWARERMDPEDYLSSSYFEKWLTSVEVLMVEKGVVSRDELRRRRHEIEHGTAPDVGPGRRDVTDRLAALILEGGASAHREVSRVPRFAAGDHVRTLDEAPSNHTRLPRYAAGRRGVVEAVQDAFVLPDAVTTGRGEQPEHVYTVRFEAGELWGVPAEPRSPVLLDLWESYLRPAGEGAAP